MLPQRSVIAQLKRTMGHMEPRRSYAELHASDVTDADFCARQVCLLDHYGRERAKWYVPMALRATFDVGELTSSVLREQWLGDAAVGHWNCLRCSDRRLFCVKPDVAGCGSGEHHWRYEEVRFAALGLTAGVDVLVDLGAPLLEVVECKIMKPEDWEKLLAPLSEHRIRTNLYLHMIRHSASPYRERINTAAARVLYVSRAYGKKHPQYNEVMPFREFVVNYQEDFALKAALADARRVQRFREGGGFPVGICRSHADPHAKNCVMAKECFSGVHLGVPL